MAIIKVITPSVTDANITTAKVTDNAITLAKMASGTDGNIISYDASGNPVAIATGNDGQVLTSTGAGSPPAFETPAGGGKILQVSSIVLGATNQLIATTSYTDLTNMSINITPTSSSSKILVVAFVYVKLGDAEGFGVRIERGSTDIYSTPTYSILADASPMVELYTGAGFQTIDSPNTTSQVTYKLGASTHDNKQVNFSPAVASYMYLMEIGA